MRKIFTLQFNLNTYRPNNKKSEVSEIQINQGETVYSAPDRCVENILNFARSYNVEETKATGKVEMILN